VKAHHYALAHFMNDARPRTAGRLDGHLASLA
jgi:hypothetical protein